MFECQTNVELVESSDEGTYSCSAEWEVDVEPSNEIDIRVMGTSLSRLFVIVPKFQILLCSQ